MTIDMCTESLSSKLDKYQEEFNKYDMEHDKDFFLYWGVLDLVLPGI